MTVVEGSVESIGLSPLSGLLTARVARFRPSGGVLLAPESVPYPIVAGQVSADLAPGPAQLTVQVGSHARERFDVVIPDDGPVSLASLVEAAFPWEPEQVAEFVRLRDEAVAAADRAEQAAEDVDSAIAGAADQVVAAVEADRVAAEADADRAQQYADSFGLTATATTGAPGTPAQVTVTGDGPAYSLSFMVPQGEKGDPGPPGEVSQAALDAALSVKADLVEGKVPESQLPELGGSTDASLLTGALTDQVDASGAVVTGQNGPIGLAASIDAMFNNLMWLGGEDGLGSKADTDHTHTAAEVGAVANEGGASGLWIGTTANLPSTGTAGVLYVTTED